MVSSTRRCSVALLAIAGAMLGACRPTPVTADPVSPTHALAVTPVEVPDGAAKMPTADGSAARCDASHSAALRIFPDDATVLAGVDIAAVIQAPAFGPFLAVDAPMDLRPALAAATQCGLGRDTWRSVTFASTLSSSNTGFALRADGAGSLDKLECVRARMKADSGKDPFTLATTPSGIELAFDDGSRGWVVDPCTVVIASKQWIAPVRARMQGVGTAAIEGRLASATARADQRKHAWLAIVTDPVLMGSTLPGVQDLAASLEVTSRVSLTASLAFAEPSAAAKQSAELERQVSSMKSMFVSMGVPQSIADRIKIGPAGSFVMISADADERELAQIAKLMAN